MTGADPIPTDDDAGAIDAVAAMLAVLDLAASDARTSEDIFTGVSQAMPLGRVYGGQVLAQSIVAASRTLPADRVPHSMHGYFLRPGDAAKGITFSVDRIHDGRSFSTRRTQAFQEGVPIFSMIASFQDEDPGIEHQAAMPDGIPDPETLPDFEARLEGLHPMTKRMFLERPVDLRHVPSPIYLSVDGAAQPHQAVWMRTRRELPDDPAVHRAALAYLSDLTIQESILRAHGIAWARPGLKVASLDHAMWWHRFGRVDEWFLYVQESPSARGGRGLATGRIYSRDGLLLASVAQEIMVRVPDESGR
ncbi:acyl-CoA thioesterase-2 [Microbacterium pygmaeum]|uniref:Acyl-CoA thioesterase 2 n=2 Tax=Microbacterium pygmaeum TaxID=370764 RepID=A0A1G8AD55_9MICO|nr:acyl-CoA thioesterase-2 [Microbacterium pygmaeum]